jgi:chromosome segregation ATPase
MSYPAGPGASGPSLSIDGVSVAPVAVDTVQEPSVAFELYELKRKLERKDLEIKRKDKDLIGSGKELTRVNKEAKHLAAELESLRDRNEQLQQNLITQKIQMQKNKDEGEAKHYQNRLRDLETAVSAAVHKCNMAEGELEASKKATVLVEQKLNGCMNELDAVNANYGQLKIEAANCRLSLESANSTNSSLEATILELNKQLNHAEEERSKFQQQNAALQAEKTACNKQIFDLKKEVKQLSTNITIRAETNDNLQSTIDELNGNRLFLSKSDIEKYKKFETDNNLLQDRISEMVKSVELHLNLLNKSDAEIGRLKNELNGANLANSDLKKSLSSLTEQINRENVINSDLKREIAASKRENEELVAHLRDKGINLDRDIVSLKASIVSLVKSKTLETEVKNQEMRKRRAIEASMKGLKSRIVFLLEQLEMAGKISVTWQEQQQLLQAQIQALTRANVSLREQLLNHKQQSNPTLNPKFAGSFDGQPLNNAGHDDSFFLTNLSSIAPDRSSSNAAGPLNDSSIAVQQADIDSVLFPAPPPLGVVERSIFDCMVAFGGSASNIPQGFASKFPFSKKRKSAIRKADLVSVTLPFLDNVLADCSCGCRLSSEPKEPMMGHWKSRHWKASAKWKHKSCYQIYRFLPS